jgi:dihydroorotase
LSEADLLIRGGRVVDQHGERVADVLVRGGHIVEVGTGLTGDETLDASDCIVAPGLVDLHVHLREPGMEEAETVETGARAAALGGFTAVVAMPNTEPALDDPAIVASVLAAGEHASCAVVSSGCITKGRAGEELAPMGELHQLGVRIFTDDGACVADAGVMRHALEYSLALPGAVVAQHAEDACLAGNGSMHEGAWSSRLGIPGRPAAAEDVIVARDLILAELTGARVHFLHVSTAGAVELVRAAKARGLPITAEAAPHHFTLTDECCASFDPVFKVHPPLRTDADVAAIKRGLADGTIDAIASDHAPHPVEHKERPFEEAPAGMLGLETSLSLALTELVEPGVLSLVDALAVLSWRPAAIASLTDHGQPIAPGAVANLCVIDPAVTWEVDALRLASKARNTPFAGRKLTGRVRHTVLRGQPVVIDGEAQR